MFRKSIFKVLLFAVVFPLLCFVFSPEFSHAQHRFGELSFMGIYSKSNYGNNTYASTRRYVAALGVNITPITEIELSYTHTKTFFNYDPIQTSKIEEDVLSLSVVQLLVPSMFMIQPYAKGGVAQYNRKQSGTVSGIPTTPTETRSPSAVLGGGLRANLLKNFSLKFEVVTIIPDLNFGKMMDNFSLSMGFAVGI